jgi:hypothetical protein
LLGENAILVTWDYEFRDDAYHFLFDDERIAERIPLGLRAVFTNENIAKASEIVRFADEVGASGFRWVSLEKAINIKNLRISLK